MASIDPTAPAPLQRFDFLVWFTAFCLLIAAALLLIRGDRAGLPVSELTPPDGAQGISGRTPIRIQFGAAVNPDDAISMLTDPPLSGQIVWERNAVRFVPDTPLMPNTTYSVTLTGSVTSQQDRSLKKRVSWTFTTRAARVVYIGWDETDSDQLFVANQDGSNVRQLTSEPIGILDFAVAPDGSQIAYAAFRDDGSTDLRLVTVSAEPLNTLLLDCATTIPAAACSGVAWHPDGARLVYERRNLIEPGAPPGPPRLYWLDFETSATAPVFDDSQWLSHLATFSPDGRWLSYVAPLDPGVRLLNLADSTSLSIPTPTGQPGWWRPDGSAVLVTDMQFRGEGFAMNLYAVDVASSEFANLSGNAEVEDGPPAWSPSGERIAFGRKIARTAMGKQIWIMNGDGSDAQRFTDDAAIHNGALSWSADGGTLLFQRYALTVPGARPGIWTLDIASGRLSEIIPAGTQPVWLY